MIMFDLIVFFIEDLGGVLAQQFESFGGAINLLYFKGIRKKGLTPWMK